MKHFRFSSIAFFGSLVISILAQEKPPANDELTNADPAVSKRLINYWAKSTCYKRGDNSEPNVKEQCKEICFPNPDSNKLSASTCWFGDSKWLDGSSGKPLEDQNKNIPGTALKGGYCGCNDPVILFAGDFFLKAVTEAGKIIEKVVCPALEALDIVIEVGMLAIPPPGKAIQGGMIAAVKTAKAYKYAYEAQDAAQEWADMIFGGLSLSKEAGCGVPKFSISKLVAKFLDFANVPDNTLPGGIDYAALPCPKGGCKGTKRDDKKDDDTKSKSPEPTKSTTYSSSFTPSATAKANCKVLGEQMQNSLPAERRGFADTLHSRRLEKRKMKEGTACPQGGKLVMKSFHYPSVGQMQGGLTYGWNIDHSCEDYAWGGITSYSNTDYHTEHVLEWSVITNFFTTMNTQFKQDEFVHPDSNELTKSGSRKKVNFCTYWSQSWDLPRQQKIDNPAPQSGLKSSTITQRKPMEWIAANYPYKQGGTEDFLDELPLLQRKINTPAKSHMFDPDNPIYKDVEMEQHIKRTMRGLKPQDAPRIAIQRMRSVVGVFKYMQEPNIARIFRDEKVRIGKVIDGIDNSLERFPREVWKGKVFDRTFDPWKPQGLGAKWDAYMDDVFKVAKDKGTKFVEDNLKLLKKEYASQQAKDAAKDDPKKSNDERNEIAEWRRIQEDIEKLTNKLEKEWNDSKNWNRPW